MCENRRDLARIFLHREVKKIFQKGYNALRLWKTNIRWWEEDFFSFVGDLNKINRDFVKYIIHS